MAVHQLKHSTQLCVNANGCAKSKYYLSKVVFATCNIFIQRKVQ
jgi:hypothetical protein